MIIARAELRDRHRPSAGNYVIVNTQGDIEWVTIGSRKYISRESLMDFIKANSHKWYYVAR